MLKDLFPMAFLVAGILVLSLVVKQERTHGQELGDSGLFKPLLQDGTEQDYLFEGKMAVERVRLVKVDFAQLDMSTKQVRLNLFDDVIVTAVRNNAIPTATGDGLVWMGKVEDMPSSQVILVSKGRSFVGTILLMSDRENGREMPPQTFEVLPIHGGNHRIQEVRYQTLDDYQDVAQAAPLAQFGTPIVQENSPTLMLRKDAAR